MSTAAAAVVGGAPYRIFHYPSQLIDRLRLKDGRVVTVRPVLPQDVEAERGLHEAMSPHSRRMRFHGAVNKLPAAILQAMTSVDHSRHVALVAEVGCHDGATRLVADARYVRGEGEAAEFAIAVADDWQGVGLGRALLKSLARHARQQGVRQLDGTVLADNAPMLAMLTGLGFEMRRDRHDSSVVNARLRT